MCEKRENTKKQSEVRGAAGSWSGFFATTASRFRRASEGGDCGLNLGNLKKQREVAELHPVGTFFCDNRVQVPRANAADAWDQPPGKYQRAERAQGASGSWSVFLRKLPVAPSSSDGSTGGPNPREIPKN
jgi:hypothetical protein